jgi:hypothetical protein
MYEIHVRGKKIAVLLTLANAVGYTEPEITFEEGDDNQYIAHGEIETKWDMDPFGSSEKVWDGSCVDLSAFKEEAIRNGDYMLCFDGVGAKYLSGMLNVEIEVLNRPDDSDNPFCEFHAYVNGKLTESSRFSNPDFSGEVPDDIEPEEFEEMFDKWHEFHF